VRVFTEGETLCLGSIEVRLVRGGLLLMGKEARAWEVGAFYLPGGGGSFELRQKSLSWPVASGRGASEIARVGESFRSEEKEKRDVWRREAA
jgi:hypothetical protein